MSGGHTIDAALLALLDDPFITLVFFVEFQFDDATMYLHTDLGSITTTVPSATWSGVGTLGTIGPIEETANAIPGRITLTLSGIDSTVLDEARNQNYQGRPMIIYFGARDGVTGVPVSEPSELAYYFMDQMVITSGDNPVITVAAISEQESWNDIPVPYFDDQTLQSTQPGDLFFKYLVDMQNLQLRWGVMGGGVKLGDQPVRTPTVNIG